MEPGGQGRQGAKKTRNFDDFWGRKPIGNTRLAELSNLMRSRKPIGNTRLAELSNLMRSGAEKSNFGFTSGGGLGTRAARRHGDFWG